MESDRIEGGGEEEMMYYKQSVCNKRGVRRQEIQNDMMEETRGRSLD